MHYADILIRGGRIYTMDDRRPQASVVGIKDGRIISVCYPDLMIEYFLSRELSGY